MLLPALSAHERRRIAIDRGGQQRRAAGTRTLSFQYQRRQPSRLFVAVHPAQAPVWREEAVLFSLQSVL